VEINLNLKKRRYTSTKYFERRVLSARSRICDEGERARDGLRVLRTTRRREQRQSEKESETQRRRSKRRFIRRRKLGCEHLALIIIIIILTIIYKASRHHHHEGPGFFVASFASFSATSFASSAYRSTLSFAFVAPSETVLYTFPFRIASSARTANL